MVNPCTKFEVSIFVRYENNKGDEKTSQPSDLVRGQALKVIR